MNYGAATKGMIVGAAGITGGGISRMTPTGRATGTVGDAINGPIVTAEATWFSERRRSWARISSYARFTSPMVHVPSRMSPARL